MSELKHTPSNFVVLHSGNTRLRGFAFRADDDSYHGEMMDAPEAMHIGCTSKRQDIVQRGFDAISAFVEVCLLQGFGKKAHMSHFEYECYFGRAAITKATGQ